MKLRPLVRSLALVLPYVARAIWQKRMRSVLVASIVGLAVAVYLVFSGYVSAYRGLSAASTEPVPVPADALSLYPASVSQGDLESSPHIRRALMGGKLEVRGPWGSLPVLGLEDEALVMLGLSLAEGRLPGRAGEVAVHAGQPGLSSGDSVDVFRLPWGREAGATWEVVGVYQDSNLPWNYPLTTLDTLMALDRERGLPNMAFITFSDTYPRHTVLEQVKRLGSPVLVLTEETAALQISQAVQRVYGPYYTVMVLVFALAGLGVLNVILLGFLERRKFMGILRAHGFLSLDMMMLLLAEGVVLATAGGILGTGAGLLLLEVLRSRTGLPLGVGPLDVLVAAVAALAVAFLGAYLPAAWSREQSVLELITAR